MTSLYPWLAPRTYEPVLTKRDVVLRVCRAHGVTFEEVVGPRRTRRIAHARQEAMWELRQLKTAEGTPKLSLPSIGMYFHRDHTTVLHALRAVEMRRSAQIAEAA